MGVGVVQLVRDLVSWCGLRQVSRRTFVRALQEKGSVMLVPGGQAELVHTWRIKRKKEYVVYSGHKGETPAPLTGDVHACCSAGFAAVLCVGMVFLYGYTGLSGMFGHIELYAACSTAP